MPRPAPAVLHALIVLAAGCRTPEQLAKLDRLP